MDKFNWTKEFISISSNVGIDNGLDDINLKDEIFLLKEIVLFTFFSQFSVAGGMSTNSDYIERFGKLWKENVTWKNN